MDESSLSADLFKFSDGAAISTMLDALIHLKLNPDLTVHDVRGADVTARFKRILTSHGYGPGDDKCPSPTRI